MSDNASAILRALGLNPDHATVRRITGGVSAETDTVSLPDGDVIVEQALAILKVCEQRSGDTGRLVAQEQGPEWFTPDYAPRPLGVIEDLHGLLLSMAPQACPDLRTVMIDPLSCSGPSGFAHLLTLSTFGTPLIPAGL